MRSKYDTIVDLNCSGIIAADVVRWRFSDLYGHGTMSLPCSRISPILVQHVFEPSALEFTSMPGGVLCSLLFTTLLNVLASWVVLHPNLSRVPCKSVHAPTESFP